MDVFGMDARDATRNLNPTQSFGGARSQETGIEEK